MLQWSSVTWGDGTKENNSWFFFLAMKVNLFGTELKEESL